MKSLKAIALMSLIGTFSLNTAQAQTQTQTTKPTANQQQAKQTQQQKKKQKKAPVADEALKQFNDAFSIRFVGWQFVKDNAGKEYIQLRYDLTNKSQKDIQGVQFIGGFTHKEQIIYAQEVPLTFNTPLKAKTNVVLDISVPVEKLPTQAVKIMSQDKPQVGVMNGAQILIFTDNSVIEVK